MAVAASEMLSGWLRYCPARRKAIQKGTVMVRMRRRLNVPKLLYIVSIIPCVTSLTAAVSCAVMFSSVFIAMLSSAADSLMLPPMPIPLNSTKMAAVSSSILKGLV